MSSKKIARTKTPTKRAPKPAPKPEPSPTMVVLDRLDQRILEALAAYDAATHGVVSEPTLPETLVRIAGCARTLRHHARYLESSKVAS